MSFQTFMTFICQTQEGDVRQEVYSLLSHRTNEWWPGAVRLSKLRSVHYIIWYLYIVIQWKVKCIHFSNLTQMYLFEFAHSNLCAVSTYVTCENQLQYMAPLTSNLMCHIWICANMNEILDNFQWITTQFAFRRPL